MRPPIVTEETSNTNAFHTALDETESAQDRYAAQLGMVDRIPFTAETLPSARVAVPTNGDLQRELASHILNKAGHALVADKRGAGKTLLRDQIHDALGDRDDFSVVRIKETASLTQRRTYTRLLDGLQAEFDAFELDDYPHATDDVLGVLEGVADQLEDAGQTVVVELDQMEDLVGDRSRLRDVLAGLQAIGDQGDTQPVFLLFLFGTPVAADAVADIRDTLDSRLVAKDRSLERFGFDETAELIGRWLAWARNEEYTNAYATDPFTPAAIEAIVETTDGTPRAVRQACYHAFRAGAQQYADTDIVRIDDSTLAEYATERFGGDAE